MTNELFKLIHIAGILMLFSGLCALWGVYAGGHTPNKSTRITLAVIHGIGMALLLVSGLMQLSALGAGFPLWAILKGSLWLVLGVSMVLAKRRASWGPLLIWFWIACGVAAAFCGIYKPG